MVGVRKMIVAQQGSLVRKQRALKPNKGHFEGETKAAGDREGSGAPSYTGKWGRLH